MAQFSTNILATLHNSEASSLETRNQGAHSFSTMTFHDFSITKKMKIHDVSAQHIFPHKLYTTYECIPELLTDSCSFSLY